MNRTNQITIVAALALTGLLGYAGVSSANPALTPGVWTDITPPNSNPSTNSTCGLDIDPSNPNVIYVGQLNNGMWKTTDAGASWTKLGNGVMGNPVTGLVDLPSVIAVDPNNPQHLYTCHAGWGGTGSNLGFWISTNGGTSWTMTQGFIDASKLPGSSTDAAKFDVDPVDFNHILISMRYVADDQFGFLESTDGGASFIHHLPPTTWEANTHGIHFLHNDNDPGWTQRSHTWNIDTDGHGWWRTTDAGATWTQTATAGGLHGGTHNLYYADAQTIYAGGTGANKSTDNGKTWQSIASIPYAYYGVMFGDGKNIYGCSSQGSNGGTVYTSSDGGKTWGSPAPIGWADQMRFDKVNRIVYMTGFATGVWALKLPPTSTQTQIAGPAVDRAVQKSQPRLVVNRTSRNLTGLYDISGKAIHGSVAGCQALVVGTR